MCGDEYVEEEEASVAGFFIGEGKSKFSSEALSELMQLMKVLDTNEDVVNIVAV